MLNAVLLTATIIASVVGVVGLSYVVEALRRRPETPRRLSWAQDVSIDRVMADGVRIRYIKVGAGPPIVLLHTLRTQLDIFQTLIPSLATQFTVYALDYPGHGWSEIPPDAYAPENFYRWTASCLDALSIEQATLVGVSIGGTIALVLAARKHRRVARVIAINPYDYPPLSGIRRSSLMARLILGPANIPILGATLMRLRTRYVSDRIMEGGVAHVEALSPDLRRELYEVGARPGHYRGFLNLLAHEHLWSCAKAEYPRIQVPALLIYGSEDWAPDAMRKDTGQRIPDVVVKELPGGHFLSLDRPQELGELMREFALPALGFT